VLVDQQLLLHFLVTKTVSNLTVVNFPLSRKGESVHLIGHAHGLLAMHDSPSLAPGVGVFLQLSETLSGEHSLPVVLWEDSKLADVFESMVAEAIALN